MKHEIHREFFELHRAFRARLVMLLDRVEELGFQAFELYRTPQRQRYLYSKGRFGPFASRRIVTRARPWSSFHQYGLAADLVLRDPGWTWRSGPEWALMRAHARDCGLVVLRSELPHVQYPWDLARLRAGEYPAGGGNRWARVISDAIASYPRGAPKRAPVIVRSEREIDRPCTRV